MEVAFCLSEITFNTTANEGRSESASIIRFSSNSLLCFAQTKKLLRAEGVFAVPPTLM
jgi:hypothetical protein